MLPERAEKALLRRYHENGDLAAREQLIEQYMSLVRSLARRYSYRGEQLEDLVQIGAIGLIKAIDRFDLDRGVELTTYATPNIIGEIKRHFRDKGWSVRVPRGLQELNVQLSRLVEQLTVQLGRSPTIPELAKAAGTDEESVLEALESGRAYDSVSLSATGDGDEDGDLDPLDSLGKEEPRYQLSEEWAVLAPGFRVLDVREREILHLRFFKGLTQSQIASRRHLADARLAPDQALAREDPRGDRARRARRPLGRGAGVTSRPGDFLRRDRSPLAHHPGPRRRRALARRGVRARERCGGRRHPADRATPHVRHDYPTTPGQMERGVADVRAALAERGIPVEICTGGEVALDFLGELDDGDLRRFTYAQDGRYLLVEFPYYGWPLALEHEVLRLLRPASRPWSLTRSEIRRCRSGPTASRRSCGRRRRAVDGRVARRAPGRQGEEGGAGARPGRARARDRERRPAPDLRATGLSAAARSLKDEGLARYMTEDAPAAIAAGRTLPPPGRDAAA